MKKLLLSFMMMSMILVSCSDNLSQDCQPMPTKAQAPVAYVDKSDDSFHYVLDALEQLYPEKMKDVESGRIPVNVEYYTSEEYMHIFHVDELPYKPLSSPDTIVAIYNFGDDFGFA